MQSLFQRKILLTIVGFILLAFAIGGGVIYPTYTYIRQLDRETYNLRVTLEKKNEQATSYRFAIKQVEKIKETIPPFADHLYSLGNELSLITTLEALATSHDVVQTIRNSNLDNITNHKILISLSISGTYERALSYLNALEHLSYFINVNRLSLTPLTDRSKNLSTTSNVNMNLDLSLYAVP